MRLKLEVCGDRRALDNPFHWEKVVFNLPGSKGYQADLPWVMKIRSDGELAAEVFVYVDDGRAIGPTFFWHGKRGERMGLDAPGEEYKMP
jgi:hypothetical protein